MTIFQNIRIAKNKNRARELRLKNVVAQLRKEVNNMKF